MTGYKHILVAINVSDDYESVVKRALMLKEQSCRLSIIHCIEPVPYPENYVGGLIVDLHEKAKDFAVQEIEDLITKYDIDIDNDDIRIDVGKPASLIHKYATDNDVDLVVVGTHGKHGLQLLWGSTSSAVLHHAKYDVLAVRLFD